MPNQKEQSESEYHDYVEDCFAGHAHLHLERGTATLPAPPARYCRKCRGNGWLPGIRESAHWTCPDCGGTGEMPATKLAKGVA